MEMCNSPYIMTIDLRSERLVRLLGLKRRESWRERASSGYAARTKGNRTRVCSVCIWSAKPLAQERDGGLLCTIQNKAMNKQEVVHHCRSFTVIYMFDICLTDIVCFKGIGYQLQVRVPNNALLSLLGAVRCLVCWPVT